MADRNGTLAGNVPAPVQDLSSCVPLVPGNRFTTPATAGSETGAKKPALRHPARREQAPAKDSMTAIWRDGAVHIISESYGYKTEPYYTILRHELEGRMVRPASRSVLDAYVVPVCLERAARAGIPVCDWEISQGYAPLPSILYGINYFATASEFCIVRDNARAKEAVKHITNKGKYPFCYQKISDHVEIRRVVSIFGRTAGDCPAAEEIALQAYDLFAIPLVTMVLVEEAGGCRLSSLSPTRYSQLTPEERSLLAAYIAGQEFL